MSVWSERVVGPTCDPEVDLECEDNTPFDDISLWPQFIIGIVSAFGLAWPMIVQMWKETSNADTFFKLNGFTFSNFFYSSTTSTMFIFGTLFGLQFLLFLGSFFAIEVQYLLLVYAEFVDKLYALTHLPTVLAFISFVILKESKVDVLGTNFWQFLV